MLLGQDTFFEDADIFFKKYVRNGLVDYSAIQAQPESLEQLARSISDYELNERSANYKKAFWINTYNILTIHKIIQYYPTTSPLQIKNFFEGPDRRANGKDYSLNQIEQLHLLEVEENPDLHFVLVCAAIDCPKLLRGAYFPETVDEQITAQVKAVLNDPKFVKIERSETLILLSEIFRWYHEDFNKGDSSIRKYINNYRRVPLPKDYKIKFYDYDWSLNDVKNTRIIPFRASALLAPGVTEVKIFNSLYTQTTNDGFDHPNSRGSFFSSFTQVLYGWKNNLNIGFDFVYKSNVTNDFAGASPFKTLQFQKSWTYQTFDCNSQGVNISDLSGCRLDAVPDRRDTLHHADGGSMQTHQDIGLSHFGPKIKFSPIKKWSNLSLQQTLYIPIQKAVDGSTVSFTQLFYDKPIGTKSQLFVEGSLWMIVQPDFRPFPFIKAFYSYFPTKKWTVYGMAANLVEYGAGMKYFILPQLEIELLYTYYLPWEAVMQDRRAMTFNFGIRYQG